LAEPRGASGATLRLKPGRDKSLRQLHPWIFAGGVDRVDGNPRSGHTVRVINADGAFLAYAAFSGESQIRARVWSFDPDASIDAAFIARRVDRAVAARAAMRDVEHTGCRLVHGESDGLPGVIADRYGEVVVMQLSAAGAERWRETLADALAAIPGVTCVYERSDAEVRALEGLSPQVGPLRGALPPAVALVEDGLRYRVDVVAGQKTGFYLDQRDNRRAVRTLASGRDVLNVFCYTGGFTIAALAGGAATVTSIDSSAEALALAQENVAANPALDAARCTWLAADAFATLRRLRDGARTFDLIVVDPPKFAPTAAHVERAARAYKDVNLWALKLLRANGVLATFSCSGAVDAALFQKIVAGAAVDARVEANVIGRLNAAADHPVALAFPEGDYLKGLLVRRLAS
jgi:23S rRNA (cytosine1962-C5)-methyltransferase